MAISVVTAFSGYLVFHRFFLDKKIKLLSHFAGLGLNSAQVAHDMRSPLATFKGLLPLLGKSIKIENEDIEQMLQVLGCAHLRLDGICEDLLAKQQGTTEAVRGFRLHTIIDELIGEAKANRTLANVTFNRHYDEQSIFFLGRQNRLQRMFANIIKNAIEALNFKGEITVTTSIKGDEVIVSIQDNGPGMSPEVIKKILDKGITKGKVKGNGLGMQFVREVIQNHNGKLSIDSTIGKGTTIHVQLPGARLEAVKEQNEVAQQPAPVQLAQDIHALS